VHSLPWLSLFALANAGAVLSKGPAGLLLPWVSAVVYFVIIMRESGSQFSWRHFFSSSLIFGGFISLLIAGTWYLLAYLDGGSDFLKVQFLKENVSRLFEVEGIDPGHKKPFYFSVINLLLGFLPWSLLLPVFISWLWNKRKDFIKIENESLLFSLVWLSVLLLATTFSGSKRTVYMLPAYPAFAFLFASALRDVFLQKSTVAHKLSGLLLGILALAGVVVVGGIAMDVLSGDFIILNSLSLKANARTNVLDIYSIINSHYFLLVGLLVLLFALFVSVVLCWRGSVRLVAFPVSFATISIAMLVNAYFLPPIAVASSPRDFLLEVKKTVGDSNIVQYKNDFYSVAYYAERNVRVVSVPGELPSDLSNLAGDLHTYVISKEADVGALKESFPDAEMIMQSEFNAANGEGKLVLFSLS